MVLAFVWMVYERFVLVSLFLFKLKKTIQEQFLWILYSGIYIVNKIYRYIYPKLTYWCYIVDHLLHNDIISTYNACIIMSEWNKKKKKKKRIAMNTRHAKVKRMKTR